jgi:hypothetical protein
LRKSCERRFEVAIGSGFNDNELQPSVRAAASTSATMDWVPGNSGFVRTPNRAALGINSRSICNRFGAKLGR